MVIWVIESFLDTAKATFVFRGCGNRANQSLVCDKCGFFGMKEIDSLDSDFLAPIGKLEKRGVLETPATDRMLEAHLTRFRSKCSCFEPHKSGEEGERNISGGAASGFG